MKQGYLLRYEISAGYQRFNSHMRMYIPRLEILSGLEVREIIQVILIF